MPTSPAPRWSGSSTTWKGPARRRWTASSCSAPSTPGWCGRWPTVKCMSPTRPTPRAPCSTTSATWSGISACWTSWASPCPCCRKWSPPPRCMATPPVVAAPASPSPVSPVTSSPPCSASSASKKGWPRTPTAPAASCWWTQAPSRFAPITACWPQSPSVRKGKWTTHWKGPCLWAAPPSSGCVTSSKSSTMPATPTTSRARWATPTASTWCRLLSVWVPPTGIRMLAAPWSAWPVAPTATTSSVRRSNPSPTRAATCWMRCSRTPASSWQPWKWTVARSPTTSWCSSSPTWCTPR